MLMLCKLYKILKLLLFVLLGTDIVLDVEMVSVIEEERTLNVCVKASTAPQAFIRLKLQTTGGTATG